MIGKLLAGLAGSKIAGRKHETAGALAGVAAEIAVKRVIPVVLLAGGAVYAYKKLSDILDEEFGGSEPTYPSEDSPSP